ncbi:hypothetical protein M0D69_10425 [Caballeronia sp. SEWSISQ10-4 2]|uniref:hypothetical protein n=1 Tax=Caballeronia sp. SEWSISQ10-4 2 TaxID=2937438 RepID=UPI002652560C|nr:hypothetical protein [Caballeronia sp. SEWSISQ10-4 2]MDN7178431.1 hypothetical protein [Caballeronia sp. SEWSISQ10-4 2]
MEEKIIVMAGRSQISSSTPATLPDAFANLQPFVERWALATETERNTQRHAVGMDAILAFKDAMLPRVDAVMQWLDTFPLNALPDAAKPLMYLLLSFAEVAPAVEFYKQPAVIDGYDPRRFVADETFTMRPAI